MRDARARRKVTVDQAAAATRIRPAFLEALEDGDYTALPGPAYVAGFLRNYARYLGLHPDDVVGMYHSHGPRTSSPAEVKAATRVLANGQEQQHRSRLLWSLVAVVALLAAGFAIKQYNDTYAHAYSPPLAVTATNLGVPPVVAHHVVAQHRPVTLRLRLRPTAQTWVRVTVDGVQTFQGPLAGHARVWQGHHTIYVLTYDGTRLRASLNGRPMGRVASSVGPGVWAATSAGWRRIL